MLSILMVALFAGLSSTLGLSGYIYPASNSTAPVNNLKVFLNGKHEARVNKKGFFFFDELPQGKYLLTVPSSAHTFPTYEVEIFPSDVKAFQIDDKERFYIPTNLPLEIFDKGGKQYFEIKEPFNIQSFIKSPYGIMILVTVGLILCMKNMPNMEELQNADRVQRQRTGN